jgi:phosphoglycolate phosphatase
VERYFDQNVEAVIFDFEGTLVDFQWKLSEAVERALERLWQIGFAKSQIRSSKYSTLLTEAVLAAPEIGLAPEYVRGQIGAIYDVYDRDALTRWRLRPAVKDFLHALEARGIRIAVVSNVGGEVLAKALSGFGLAGLFETCVSRHDVTHPKPSSEGIDLALRRMNVQKDRALFIGDSLDDVQAARNAQLKVLIITNGENPTEEILAARPDGVFESYQELLGNP